MGGRRRTLKRRERQHRHVAGAFGNALQRERGRLEAEYKERRDRERGARVDTEIRIAQLERRVAKLTRKNEKLAAALKGSQKRQSDEARFYTDFLRKMCDAAEDKAAFSALVKAAYPPPVRGADGVLDQMATQMLHMQFATRIPVFHHEVAGRMRFYRDARARSEYEDTDEGASGADTGEETPEGFVLVGGA